MDIDEIQRKNWIGSAIWGETLEQEKQWKLYFQSYTNREILTQELSHDDRQYVLWLAFIEWYHRN